MIDLSPTTTTRDLCDRATPYRLLTRVAGIAFNFSAVKLVSEMADEPLVEIEAAFQGS